jgi:hypothetical protein
VWVTRMLAAAGAGPGSTMTFCFQTHNYVHECNPWLQSLGQRCGGVVEKALKRRWPLISRCAFVFRICSFFTFIRFYLAVRVQRCGEHAEKVLNRMRALTSRKECLIALTTADTLVQSQGQRCGELEDCGESSRGQAQGHRQQPVHCC